MSLTFLAWVVCSLYVEQLVVFLLLQPLVGMVTQVMHRFILLCWVKQAMGVGHLLRNKVPVTCNKRTDVFLKPPDDMY